MDDKAQKISNFVLKIIDIAEEDDIPFTIIADVDMTVIGVFVGEPELMEVLDDVLINKTKDVH
jgi:hypothetical protein